MKIRTSTKQQQNNIIPFPSFITNKTKQKRNANKTHTHTQTYSLRRRMADPVKYKNRNKRKREHRKWRFGPQQNNNKITSYPSLLRLQTRPSKNEMQIKHKHTHKITDCAEEWPIPVKTRTETREKENIENEDSDRTKQQQNNIIPFPSLITNKTEQ